MSDFIPKPGSIKIGGLSRKAQKLQALREKAAQTKTGEKPISASAADSFKGKGSLAGHKKTAFNRKAV